MNRPVWGVRLPAWAERRTLRPLNLPMAGREDCPRVSAERRPVVPAEQAAYLQYLLPDAAVAMQRIALAVLLAPEPPGLQRVSVPLEVKRGGASPRCRPPPRR
ncbi:MAG: hypothetical protein ABIF28_11245 [Pseudomonadota bacterium]